MVADPVSLDTDHFRAGGKYVISELESVDTGDQDLLARGDRHPILTPADFWRRHGG